MSANKTYFNGPGGLVIPRLAADPASPEVGEIYYNTSDGKVKKYEAVSGWTEVPNQDDLSALANDIADLQTNKYDASNPNGYETPSELDSRDADNRDRSNHTGTQDASSISDFASTVLATVLTGLTPQSGTVVDTDTILQALEKIVYTLGPSAGALPTGYINGFVPSYVDADEITIGAGVARDISDTYNVVLGSSTKTLSSPAASTTYHCIVIREDSSGNFDWYYDTSVTGANVAGGWTVMRRVFSFRTNGSSQIIDFDAYGSGDTIDISYDRANTTDFSSSSQSVNEAAPTVVTLSVPTGLTVRAHCNYMYLASGSGGIRYILIWSGNRTVNPGGTGSTNAIASSREVDTTSVAQNGGTVQLFTSTSGTINVAASTSGRTLSITTTGYTYFR